MTNKKKKTNNLTRPLFILGAIILGVMIWYSWPRPAPVDINLVGNETGTVTLSLSPATINLEPNSEATLTLSIDAGTSHAQVAQVELAYDAAKIGTPTLSQGDFFDGALGTATVAGGKINFTYVSLPGSDGVTGSGTLATLKIKPPIVGSSSLTITQNTIILAKETGNNNTLKSALDATIVVAAAAASVEPSAIASAEPSAAASVAPSTPASAQPSTPATPQKPSKPTGLQSNCFDGGNKITLRWDAVTGANSYKLRMDQKDGNSDKSIDGITKTDYEFNVIPDQKYSWWVHTTKDGVDSEEAKIAEVVCAKTIASATATPKPTVKPTAKPTARPTSTPITRTPTPRPSTASTIYIPPSPFPYTCPELCGDGICNVTCGESFANCKADCTINDYSTGLDTNEVAVAPISFWQKLIDWITNLFVPTEN